MELKKPQLFIIFAFGVAWSYDLLFWNNVLGISFSIFIILSLGIGLLLSYKEKIYPAKRTLWLIAPILFFAVMTFIRLEPLSNFLSFLFTLISLAVFTHSYLGGKWYSYSIINYLSAGFGLIASAISLPRKILPQLNNDEKDEGSKSKLNRAFPYIRGVILAIPLLLIFTSLLASADPIFSRYVEDLLDFIDDLDIGEFLFRSFYVLVLTYLMIGIYLHAFHKNHDENIGDPKTNKSIRFLGYIETTVILISVLGLFSAFILTQFQYFFGGSENINLEGFTYAQYARRGFGELVMVAFLSLSLFFSLSWVSRRETDSQQKVFSGLGIGIGVMVVIMLISAFKRLLLYEAAFGFTRLRTYTHVFIIWLGLLIISFILLEYFRKQYRFLFAVMVIAVGFAATINIINVDSFIVKQNLSRANQGESLDIGYLSSLSPDSLAALTTLYSEQSINEAQREKIAAVITCLAIRNVFFNYETNPGQTYKWQSFHVSRFSATSSWNGLVKSTEFRNVFDFDSENTFPGSELSIKGNEINCWGKYPEGIK